ncbi:MAG: transposase [Bacilli bacterium]
MITKAVWFQIVKPLDTDWDEFGQVLRDLSYHTTKMCNAAIQLYWEHHNKRLQYKSEQGKYPKDRDLYGMSFRNVVYRKLRDLYPLMASANTSQTNQFAMNRWQNDIKSVMRLQKSIPSFRLGAPIHVANANYRLDVVEGGRPEYRAEITLLSREAEKGRFLLLLDGGDASKKAIFMRIMDGTYKKGAMQIIQHKRKKKWFCILSYSFEPEVPKDQDETRSMGVNFGDGAALRWAFSFSPRRGFIPEDEIRAAEDEITAVTARRKSIQRAAPVKGEGRKRRLRDTESLRGRAPNIRNAINNKYSKRIVRLAVANRCATIKLANMSGVKTEGSFKSWPWADLIEKIRYKAEEQGIKVQLADRGKAFYTCSKCGYSNPENVEGNAEFLTCKNPDCRARIDMKYNTVRNVAVSAEVDSEKKNRK